MEERSPTEVVPLIFCLVKRILGNIGLLNYMPSYFFGAMLFNLSILKKEKLRFPRQGQGIPSYIEPSLTYGIISFLAAVYFCELQFSIGDLFQLTPSNATLIALGGLNKAVMINTNEWYRVLTAPFLNGSVVALTFNLIVIFILGSAFERLIGRLWYFAFFVLCATNGSLMSVALNSSFTTSVGTAGVMTGLAAALYIFSFRLEGEERDRLQIRVLCTLILFLWPIVNGVRHNSRIFNYGAHLGGALTGIAFGFMLLKTWPRKSRTPPLRGLALKITIISSVALAISVPMVALQYPKYKRLLWLIPTEEMPITNDDKIAQSANLVVRYPQDPRAHIYRSFQLLGQRDFKGNQRELETALADAQSLHFIFGTNYEAAIQRQIKKPDQPLTYFDK